MKHPFWQIGTLDNVADIQTGLFDPAVFLRESIRSRATIAEQQQIANNPGTAHAELTLLRAQGPALDQPSSAPRTPPRPTLLRAQGPAPDQPSSAPRAPSPTNLPPRPGPRPRPTFLRA